MSEGTVDVTVVVCTRNRASGLVEHFGSIVEASAASGLVTEVVVVDNGSTDGTAALVSREFPSVRVVSEPTPGLSIARNSGVRAARGRVVLFTDDDVAVPIDWVTRMASPLLDGEADVVVGGIRVADHLRQPWMTTWLLANFADHPEPLRDGPDVVGASFGALRDVLTRVPFDERLGVPPYQRAEDSLFAMQVREAGLRVLGVGGEPCVHYFDAERLRKPALESLAAAAGRCSAYIWYHWVHGPAPRLEAKAIAFRVLRAVALPGLREHPTDRDLQYLSRVAFVDELRRIRSIPPYYPHPDERRAARDSAG